MSVRCRRGKAAVVLVAAAATATGCCCCFTGGDFRRSSMRSSIAMQGARSVVEGMYAAINSRDLEKALSYVAEDIKYEDFTYQEPFEGRGRVAELFSEAMELPSGLDFVIDETAGGEAWSDEDSVGMTWHVELDGVPLPNGRGASLYRTRGGKLVYARDIVESPLKLGGAALGILGFIAPIIKASRKSNFAEVGPAPLFALAAIVYWYVLLLSPQGQFPFLAGPPAWAIDETTLRNVVDESLNFFYIWPGLDELGLPSPTSLGIPLPKVDPLRLALFNFSEAYALMFLPLLLWDRPRRTDVVSWWSPAMFLTNGVLLPYFTTRALAPPSSDAGVRPSWAPAFGFVALAVAFMGLWQAWGLFGGFAELVFSDRVAFAFVVDCVVFSMLQAYVFAGTAGPAWRYVPFLGLAAWLLLPEVASIDETKRSSMG
eukprot:TRINITY_DN77100_c0_g1_i1.p1 TRINITY_DN77100_c0_g1~~TRINITY_DN77100_c0_g1_i1.p1  ORF type:complete len:429 (+),score=54.09 TRINITY_DN77100_c0_g1_i1:56-1342(+)